MILLDTNVISELARPQPAAPVLRWAEAIQPERLCTTAISESELRFGLALLPPGKRHDEISRALEALFLRLLGGRVFPFDRAAARAYAAVAAARRQAGRPGQTADLQIAAVAVARGVENVATRDIAGFEGSGVTVLNPCSPRQPTESREKHMRDPQPSAPMIRLW